MVNLRNVENGYCLTFAPANRLPMKRVVITTFEEIHHVCLMYGLKKAFLRFPFLAADMMATPPPVRRNPERLHPLLGFRRHPVYVQYYRKDIYVIYDEDKAGVKEVTAFAKAAMEEYLSYRHPYMKTAWINECLSEAASGHTVATINPETPETADRP